MTPIRACALPDHSLLQAHRERGAYTDCYVADVARRVQQSELVTAFYTSRIFKLERLILRWFWSKPSTDAEAAQLAAGKIYRFAAWQIEGVGVNQLLLADLSGRTRSWLMTEPIDAVNGVVTRLYFGSAVIPVANAQTGKSSLGRGFRALLGFHRLYSVILLRAAVAKLR